MRRRTVIAAGLAAALMSTLTAHGARLGVTTLVSATALNSPGNGASHDASTAIGGDIVAFSSLADDLVASDTNGTQDVFVSMQTSPTTWSVALISLDENDQQVSAPSRNPSASGDGRLVVFESDAPLVASDTNGVSDVYLVDRDPDEDGIYDEPGERAVWLVSRTADGKAGNGPSHSPDLPPYSTTLAFASEASDLDLLSGADSEGQTDVFAYGWQWNDLAVNELWRVSQTPAGDGGDAASYDPAVAPSGEYVVFTTDATNLVFGDTNGFSDVYLSDHASLTRISEGVSVGSTSPTQANGPSFAADVNYEGDVIVFASNATNLVAGASEYTDIYLRDLRRDVLELVSVAAAGGPPDGASTAPSLFSEPLATPACVDYDESRGEDLQCLPPESVHVSQVPLVLVAFESEASNLVDAVIDGDADTNGVSDVFLRDVFGQVTERISLTSSGIEANGPSWGATVSHAGGRVAFVSEASNLKTGDVNAVADVFLRDRQVCATGAPEDGPLSSPVHEHGEFLAGRAGPLLHEASCDVLEPNEL